MDNPRYERANIVFNSKTFKEEEHPRDEKGRWTKEDYNAEVDKYLKGKYQSADRLKVVEHPSQPWLNAGLQDAEIFLTGATYDKSTKGKHNVSEETMRNLPDLLNNPKYIFKSSTVPGSFVGVLDDFEEEKGIKKPLIAAIKPEQGKFAINLIPSVYGKDPDFPYRETFKNNLLYERPENNKTVSNNIVASIATETLKQSKNIITNIQTNFNPSVTKHEAIKEQDMALIDELKNLIKKVENNKEDNMEKENDKEVNNEDVDKRKILREADAIAMKPASEFKGGEEEKFRTLTKKLEELSYNKSSTGTADNADDDGCKDKEVKNETKKDKDEVKDLEKDLEKDVENKCNNSVSNSKPDYFERMNKIYNAANEPPKDHTEYISRADRLKAAEEYYG